MNSHIAFVNWHRSGSPLTISHTHSRLTLDIIGPTAVGRDFQSLTTSDNRLAQAFHDILEPSADRLLFFGLHFIYPESIIKRLPWELNRILDRTQKFLRALCYDIVREKRHDLLTNKGATVDHDMLGMIMHTEDFNDDELVDQMLTFLAAGVRFIHPRLSPTIQEPTC